MTQTATEVHPATTQRVQRALHQLIFRPVCETGQSPSCNNLTGNVDHVDTFSLEMEADVQLQLFTASSLLADSFIPKN